MKECNLTPLLFLLKTQLTERQTHIVISNLLENVDRHTLDTLTWQLENAKRDYDHPTPIDESQINKRDKEEREQERLCFKYWKMYGNIDSMMDKITTEMWRRQETFESEHQSAKR
jgi:hypothetical protein